MNKVSNTSRNLPLTGAYIKPLLRHFLNKKDGKLSESINLAQLSLELKISASDELLLEVCAVNPLMENLDLTECQDITDAGLLSLSDHCYCLKKISFSGCIKISHVGLRSLVLKNGSVVKLDLTKCHLIDDKGLRSIAVSLNHLKELDISGCYNVTDFGISAVARCCPKIEILKLRCCINISKFGDKGIVDICNFCPLLKVLDLYGCPFIGDNAVLEASKKCSALRKISLYKCKGLTSMTFRRLVENDCRKGIIELEIVGWLNMNDEETKYIANSSQCRKNMRRLNISQSPFVTSGGLKQLVSKLKRLEYLDLSKCFSIDDRAMELLSIQLGSKKLLCPVKGLNLSGCKKITENGVLKFTQNFPYLSSLNLTKCERICQSASKDNFLHSVVFQMPFAEISSHSQYFGFKPKPNEESLRNKASLLSRQINAAVILQSLFRGALVRHNILRRRRLEYVILNILPKIQACFRGYLQRRIWKYTLENKRQSLATIVFQKYWRGLICRRYFQTLIMCEHNHRREETNSIIIQRVYRGYSGRLAAKITLNHIVKLRLLEAKTKARLEKLVVLMQSNFRRKKQQEKFKKNLLQRKQEHERNYQCRVSVLRIQSVHRGYKARKLARNRKEELELIKLRVFHACKIQGIWRGKKVRKIIEAARKKESDERRILKASIDIQRYWRVYLDKCFLDSLRNEKYYQIAKEKAARVLQRLYRGRVGRSVAVAARALWKDQFIKNNVAISIQRVFRGHKEREMVIMYRSIRHLEEVQAKPLYKYLEVTEISLKENQSKQIRLKLTLKKIVDKLVFLEKEIDLMTHSKQKYWDSDIISLTPQRFPIMMVKVRNTCVAKLW